ncbi:MAG: hypothetical protein D6698_10275, partial [Gammaproteobacteria bacterium]
YRFIDGIMVEGKFWQMIEEYGGQESLRAQQDALFILSIRAYAKGQQTRAFDYFNRYLTSDTPYSLRYQIARKLLEEMNRQVRGFLPEPTHAGRPAPQPRSRMQGIRLMLGS